MKLILHNIFFIISKIRRSLILLFSVVLNACTPVSPVFDFDFSNEKSSLNLEINTDVSALNFENNAKVTLSGVCEPKSVMKLLSPVVADIECQNGNYQKLLDLSSLSDGELEFILEIKNVFGEVSKVSKKLQKDIKPPLLNVSQPSAIAVNANAVNLNGTCSEEGEEVALSESSTGLTQKTLCSAGIWSLAFSLGSSSAAINNFDFKVKHKDKAGNFKVISSITVIRAVMDDYNIVGLASGLLETYGSTLKTNFNNFYVKWTTTSNVAHFQIDINQYNSVSGKYDISKCIVSGISGNQTLYNLTSCSLVQATNYQVKLVGTNAQAQSVYKYFNFQTKAPPVLRADAAKLYVSSQFDSVVITNIPFADIINDDTESGPHTLTLINIPSDISAIVSLDNDNQKLILTTTTHLSGVYTLTLQINDKYNNQSDNQILNLHFVMPYSWTGVVDNNFNNKQNWCGSITLKGGCQGTAEPPSFSTKIMIDNLCTSPIASWGGTNHCAPELTEDSYVHTFYLKSNQFNQNGYALTVGNIAGGSTGELARNKTFFKQSGGQFNLPSSTGDLTVLHQFNQLGGFFYAPKNANLTFNSRDTLIGSAFAVISNKLNFFHNNGTIIFKDPLGGSGEIVFDSPLDLEVYNLKIDSDGGKWKIRSNNLIVNGDLILSGRMQSSSLPMLTRDTSNSKITLKGNIICSGVNRGGTLPIYLVGPQASKYLVTSSNCKLPPLYLSGTSSVLTEDPASVYDLSMQALNITTGNTFVAPAGTRKLIFSTDSLATGAYTLQNSGTFNHNNGVVEFHNEGVSEENYFIKTEGNNFHQVNFINNLGGTSFYSLQSNLTLEHLNFTGSYPIRLLGASNHVLTDDLVVDRGLYNDANKLNKIILSSTGVTPISVNTTDRVNINFLEIFRSTSFTGSASTLDFSGTTIDVHDYNLVVPSGYSLWYNTLNSSGGGIDSQGTVSSNSP